MKWTNSSILVSENLELREGGGGREGGEEGRGRGEGGKGEGWGRRGGEKPLMNMLNLLT